MSSLVVDTSARALEALGNLESPDQIAPAIERLRRGPRPATITGRAEDASLVIRMVAS